MKSIVIIVNRVARELAREGAAGSAGTRGLLDTLRSKRAGVRVVETSSMADLDAAGEEIAREVPDAVVLAGGDGSYMAGVTALARSFTAAGRNEDALPPIALAPTRRALRKPHAPTSRASCRIGFRACGMCGSKAEPGCLKRIRRD